MIVALIIMGGLVAMTLIICTTAIIANAQNRKYKPRNLVGQIFAAAVKKEKTNEQGEN